MMRSIRVIAGCAPGREPTALGAAPEQREADQGFGGGDGASDGGLRHPVYSCGLADAARAGHRRNHAQALDIGHDRTLPPGTDDSGPRLLTEPRPDSRSCVERMADP
ncbi:hypothetical protein GCM10027289_18880 [Tsukamurella serpentis]